MFTTRQILRSCRRRDGARGRSPQLQQPLAANSNARSHAFYVESHAPTYGFYLSTEWMSGYAYTSYAGYPCSRFAQPGGAKLPGYIVTSESWSRCTEF